MSGPRRNCLSFHVAIDTAEWLTLYAENSPQRWDSIALAQPMDAQKRNKIRTNTASLLDFRNYLFLRQSTLLFLLLRPWEVSQRAIQFMQNCLQELTMLQVRGLSLSIYMHVTVRTCM